MRIKNVPIISAGDMSQATLTSDEILLGQIFVCAVQAVFSGAPVGSLKLQASVDGTTWTDVANSTVAVSAAGDCLWNITDIGFPLMRCVYTKTSGTGSLTVTVEGKGN
jgi:hypothetical protein